MDRMVMIFERGEIDERWEMRACIDQKGRAQEMTSAAICRDLLIKDYEVPDIMSYTNNWPSFVSMVNDHVG